MDSGYEQQARSPRSTVSSIASHTFPTALNSTTLSPVVETISSRREMDNSIPKHQIVTPGFRDMYWHPQSQSNVKLQCHQQQHVHEGQIFNQETRLSTPDPSRLGDTRIWELPTYAGNSPIGSTGTGSAVLATTDVGDHAILSYQNQQNIDQDETVVHESLVDTFSSQFNQVG